MSVPMPISSTMRFRAMGIPFGAYASTSHDFQPSCSGLARASTPSFRHARKKTWMAGTRPAMTVWMKGPNAPSTRSHLLEVDALGDRQAAQVAAQTIHAELDCAEAHPVAAADDARAPRHDLRRGRDADVDRAAEIDAVGALVDRDQHRQRVGG